MRCLRCQNLEGVFENRQSEYIEALASPFHRVSGEFAAYKSVELERARNELEEHRSICVSAVRQPAAVAVGALPRLVLEKLQGDCTRTVA
jgi:hypothetical protein